MTPRHAPTQPEAPADPRTPFQKFQDLARRVVNTPKANLPTDAAKKALKPQSAPKPHTGVGVKRQMRGRGS